MRDYGFNFEWYDKYCENLFAKGFEKKQEKYDVLTTFELFEHLSNPVEEFERLLDKSRVIICTTNLVPDPAPKVGDWWYYSPETGQHISFYTKSAMKILAGKFNLKYSGYGNLHIFAQSKINPSKLKFAYRGSFLINKFCRYNSFLPEDYKAITGQELK